MPTEVVSRTVLNAAEPLRIRTRDTLGASRRDNDEHAGRRTVLPPPPFNG